MGRETHRQCTDLKHTQVYLISEALGACRSAETFTSSFADFMVGVELQGGEGLQRAPQWEEICHQMTPQFVQRLPPFGAPQN